ncbi:hypothetical protein I8G32_04261 [Rhodopseudomonas palustris]|uniref:Multiubiquitin domain-containing protein n=1 Tax=Rhodopseudomonas palustris (strain ATCC BAA-98 / CGA009) TaxID=258594 RepID=Q6N2C3_RHOPA|nr:multiubiquitin domain-containing protein [Rhodopseudomonas palustris]QQM05691.1 hypothetical protein I8G32_04261 [Rhodopseudomonas palustris]RJF63914.1 hypothetical protein D4Q71_12475 [Rhodopseudomonas palustris]WAB77018.1 multiubiquitin domain-containing protein [Rhodopseudomonas palustris]WCL94315.1 multiubiquitin domain-containing protein [Rhodopseudomonas palustris CGA009]WND50930.1 multiubiquitin domain-containing protein [Rhodopseudomonas palustris]
MSITDTLAPAASHPDVFAALIADESFNFRSFPFDDRQVTGAQIGEVFGAHPISDFVIIQQLESLELETLRPTELADLRKSVRFFVIRGDATYTFIVDGLTMVWPKKTITGKAVKMLTNKDEDDIEVLLEREDRPDKVIGDDDDIQLAADGVEKLKTRYAKTTVTIIVEGTPHKWDKKKISYAEVVTLEVSDYEHHPDITYSVNFTNGPHNRPEGDLAKGESVKVRDGMIFSVSETGQS